jgi:hypothetical protein
LDALQRCGLVLGNAAMIADGKRSGPASWLSILDVSDALLLA